MDEDARVNIILADATLDDLHLDISFEDGTLWDVKILLSHGALPPLTAQKYIFLSEAFTLKFLERTAVPAPKIHYHCWESSPENDVGVSFMLLEKITGRRVQWEEEEEDTRRKIIDQIAEISLELERHPFDMTGSIVPSDEPDISVGGFARIPLFRDAERPIGPFSSLNASLKAMMHLQLDIITDGEFTSLPVAHFLSYLWRLQMIPDLITSLGSQEGGPFYLKQANETGDNIFVDDNDNITGIADWTAASVLSKEYAFSAPPMLWPQEKFHNGDNDLSAEEHEFADAFQRRDRPDMADLVRNGRKLQRFLYSLGRSWTDDQKEFEALFQGLRMTFVHEGDEDDAAAVFEPYETWKDRLITKYKVKYPQLQRLFSF